MNTTTENRLNNQGMIGQPITGQSFNQQPTDGTTAADMAANLLAQEYANWETQFKPVELNLLGQSSVQDPTVLTRAISEATNTANQAYDAMPGIQQRAMAARGIAPTADQTMVQDRLTGLSRAAAVAGARNQARQNVATQDDLIAWGAAPNPNVVQGSQLAKASAGG